MSIHNTREEISASDPNIQSTAATGTTLEERGIYGVVFDVNETANSQTRKLAAPTAAGQQVSINVTLGTDTHALTVSAPTGTTFDGTNATLTFTRAAATTQLWVTLISFYISVSGVKTLSWRVLGKGAGVTLTT